LILMGFIHFYYITYKRFLELLYCPKLLIFQCSLHINYVRKLINNELNKVSRLSKSALGQLTKENKQIALTEIKSKEVYISSIYFDDNTFEPIIIIAAPIKNILGNINGAILAEVNLKFMWDLISLMQIGNSGVAYVVDREGKLIAFKDVTRVIKGENLSNLKIVAEFINNKQSSTGHQTTIANGITGNKSVSSYIPLGYPDWAFVVEIPVIEAYKSVFNSVIILRKKLLNQS